MTHLIKSLAVAGALTVGTASVATAVTVDNIDDAPAAYSYIDPTLGTALQAGTTVSVDTALITKAGSVPTQWRSPYDGSGGGSIANWEELDYFSVGPSTVSVVDFTFSSVRTMFSLLWGSIDDYNILEFYNGEVLVGTVTNADITPPTTDPYARGASYVEISGLSFDRVRFLSNQNAFEFANIAAVPLPAGGVLLLTALGGLGLAARRRKA